MNRTIGVILIVIGVIVLVWGTFGFKTRETVVDIGPIEATKETTRYVPYAPIIGGVILVAGVTLVATARKG